MNSEGNVQERKVEDFFATQPQPGDPQNAQEDNTAVFNQQSQLFKQQR